MTEDFEIIYKTYYGILRNTVENIINDKDASHDIVQEVFLKLWKKADEIHLILNLKAYLFKSAINSSLTYMQNTKNNVRLSDLKIEPLAKTDSDIITKELEVKIQIALESLPPKCRTIFVLSRFEDLKYKEIAEYMNISIKTVENQMGIALKKMRNDLRVYLPKEFLMF